MTRNERPEGRPLTREYTKSTGTVGHSTDPETVAAEITETFGAADAVAIAETIGEVATDRGRHLLIPVGPSAAALAIAGRLGSRGLAVEWSRRLLDALGHPVATEEKARRVVDRLDDHEARIVALETTTKRLVVRVTRIENGGTR